MERLAILSRIKLVSLVLFGILLAALGPASAVIEESEGDTLVRKNLYVEEKIVSFGEVEANLMKLAPNISDVCDASTDGTMRFDGCHLRVCMGGQFINMPSFDTKAIFVGPSFTGDFIRSAQRPPFSIPTIQGLSSIDYADAVCNMLANQSSNPGLPKGPGVTYSAFVGTPGAGGGNPAVVPNQKFPGGNKYLSFDNQGASHAVSVCDLYDGNLDEGLVYDHNGATASGTAWTGFAANGTALGNIVTNSCSWWTNEQGNRTGTYGTLGALDSTWASTANGACNTARRILCVQN